MHQGKGRIRLGKGRIHVLFCLFYKTIVLLPPQKYNITKFQSFGMIKHGGSYT